MLVPLTYKRKKVDDVLHQRVYPKLQSTSETEYMNSEKLVCSNRRWQMKIREVVLADWMPQNLLAQLTVEDNSNGK